MPSVSELKTILRAPFVCSPSPCIDPIFGPTASGDYWTSITWGFDVNFAWRVSFNNASELPNTKSLTNHARAVRGGS